MDYLFQEVNNTKRIILLGILAMAILLSPFFAIPVAVGVTGSFNYDEFIESEVEGRKAALVRSPHGVDCTSYPEMMNAECLSINDDRIPKILRPVDCSQYPAIVSEDCLFQEPRRPSPTPEQTPEDVIQYDESYM